MPTITFAHKTDQGRVRKMNQDSFAVSPSSDFGGLVEGLYVVADGMGGHAGGEIASRVTVETVPAVVAEVLADHTENAGSLPSIALVEALREGILAANEAVWKQARANPELRRMGTTCVALLARGAQAAVGNVGDSRMYRLRAGELVQLTQDHSLVQEHVRAGEMTNDEARGSRFRNVITRAIGIASHVEPDVELIDLQEGDTLLLCSDGLTNMVKEGDIRRLLDTPDLNAACDRLVEAALQNGGDDNITTVIVRYGAYIRPAGSVTDAPSNGANGHTVRNAPSWADDLDDDEDFDAALPASSGRAARPRDRAPGSPGRARVLTPLTAFLTLLVLALGATSFVLARAQYNFIGAWPFLKPKTAPVNEGNSPVVPPASGTIDFSTLDYGAMESVTTKAVRNDFLACDGGGGIYVVSKTSGRVLRVTPQPGKPALIKEAFPSLPPLPSDVTPANPDGTANDTTAGAGNVHVAYDAQGNLYLGYRSAHRIEKYSPKGTRIGVIGESELKAPESLAVDAQGAIYAIDSHRVVVFRPKSGSPLSGPGVTQQRTMPPQNDKTPPTRGLTVEDQYNGAR